MKRVLSIQDISCVGKCSLTVALPVLSAAGLETAILPTAVLSMHTAFPGFTFRDLSDDIELVATHWQQQKIAFDGIYTGYLGTIRQIELVEEVLARFRRKDQLCFVDPAMGDNGKLYVGFSPEFALRMGKLCGKADIIVPNLTEAVSMLGMEYPGTEYQEKDIRELLKRLCGLGTPCAVLTGVSLGSGQLGVAGYNAEKEEFFTYGSEQLPVSFHGTGDVFASAFFAGLMCGQPLSCALHTAVEYTVESMRLTLAHPDHNWYGIDFESAIPCLLRLLGRI